MLAEIFFYGIIIYLVYKLVFDLILPVSHATKQMKQQFNDVRNNMQEQQNRPQQNHNPHQQTTPQQSKNKTGEYIDFEEVK
jgi:Sec-independent protein translocase protein TatA